MIFFLHILRRLVGCEKQRLCAPWPSREQEAKLSHPGQAFRHSVADGLDTARAFY
jgi:hypothetical protein